MVERDILSDDRIQDYIDERLSERERAAVAAHVLAHPASAARLEAWRRQTEMLRGLGHEILDEPVPPRMREILRPRAPVAACSAPRRAHRFLEAAAVLLVFCAGGTLGWYANDVVQPGPSAEDLLLANMVYASAFYGERDYPVAFPPDHAAQFTSWIDRSFERDVQPPDLQDLGYVYRGGRLIPAAGTKLGLFQFEHANDARVAVFFWTAAAPPKPMTALTERDDFAARFWSGGGLNLAVISKKANRNLETAAEAVFSFYRASADDG
jgi:anti-sigma factor RsiW